MLSGLYNKGCIILVFFVRATSGLGIFRVSCLGVGIYSAGFSVPGLRISVWGLDFCVGGKHN